MHAKTHTTAVVLIPPAAVWPPIQAIRQQHDRNIQRWMPHLTLLYPFAPRARFTDVMPALTGACADIAPFTVTLARFAAFTHGQRGATLYLDPEPPEPVVALQTRLWQALPAYDDTRRHANGFTPHLSVGQTGGVTEAHTLQESLEAAWTPITFTAAAVQLIWRGEPPDDVFQLVQTVSLRGLIQCVR
jgi:RNA 2',3'-cyclic 3'-phosphodiesterase